ncbi:hypothetical protein GCM10017586_25350 [Microbacterium imperiale]|uniref:Uncharacterized protein n=3 Tax=Microbacterium imperiale TaxID=33884 RepID=A0A9W6M4J4_9MICO|nr:hypothetical protein GCM10017544_28560 [Microbacterium imperiale]GLJ80852.1 hypothetical protein GCM10017586_25350 [Microbacterium imperiale]
MWAVLVIATASMVGLVWWKRRARHVYVIDHVKLEMHPAYAVEDRVVEQVWRAAISMTNTSRLPRSLPVLAERATARAGRCVFLANVYLDADVRELNPRAVALAWIEFVLPGGVSPRAIDTEILAGDRRPRPLRLLARLTRQRAQMVGTLRSPLTLLEHR